MEKVIFNNREEFFAMVDAFRKHFNEKNSISTEAFCLYALLRGKDWRAGLTANTNEDLVNRLYYSLTKGKADLLDRKPFGETVTDEHIENLRKYEIPAWTV